MAPLDTMRPHVSITPSLVAQTVSKLKIGGRAGRESMLVWLGRRCGDRIRVESVYVPEQEAGADFFWIGPESMSALMARLRRDRLMIAAQVHTHPGAAFHSLADDRWAIVRHEGALSLVLPNFALGTSADRFTADAAVFHLTTENEWIGAPADQVTDFYKIEP